VQNCLIRICPFYVLMRYFDVVLLMGFVDLDRGLSQSRPEKRLLLLKLCSKEGNH